MKQKTDYSNHVTLEADHELKGFKQYVVFANTEYEEELVGAVPGKKRRKDRYMYLVPSDRVMEGIEKGGHYAPDALGKTP